MGLKGGKKMAKENKRRWYMTPTYLGIIVAIIAIVVSIIVWRWPNPPPPSDFSVSIDPMFGAIQAGGVMQTTVTVKGIYGYEHTVSLSASGQPPGIVIAFVPPFGEAKPSYTSGVTINVDTNAPAGDYTIIIKGTGADGKEHSCSYTLTVKPPVTPTPTPSSSPTLTPTPTPTPHVEITAPTNGENVSMIYLAQGTHSGLIDNPSLNLYVLLHPHPTDKWWVQNLPTVFSDGSWQTTIYFGTETQRIGDDYTVSAVITTEELEVADVLSRLPSYVTESHVTVTRPE